VIGTNTQAHGDILDDFNTLGAAASDGQFIVATEAGVFTYESTTTARTSLGIGESDTPTFGGMVIADDGTIGSTTTPGAVTIEGDGDILLAQKLGVGITPDALVHTYGTGGAHLRLERSQANDVEVLVKNTEQEWSQGIDRSESNMYVFATGTSLGSNRKMVMQTGGNVGFGTIPDANIHLARAVSGDTTFYIDTYDEVSLGNSPTIRFRKSNSTTLLAEIETDSGDVFGQIMWQGCDSNDGFAYGARMIAKQNGAAGGAYIPTDLIWDTYSSTGRNVDQFVLYHNGGVAIGVSIARTKLTVEGALTLKEQAAADADTAAYGQIWVKNADPNELWFTDGDGTDHQIAFV